MLRRSMARVMLRGPENPHCSVVTLRNHSNYRAVVALPLCPGSTSEATSTPSPPVATLDSLFWTCLMSFCRLRRVLCFRQCGLLVGIFGHSQFRCFVLSSGLLQHPLAPNMTDAFIWPCFWPAFHHHFHSFPHSHCSSSPQIFARLLSFFLQLLSTMAAVPEARPTTTVWYCCQCPSGPYIRELYVMCMDCSHRKCSMCTVEKIANRSAASGEREPQFGMRSRARAARGIKLVLDEYIGPIFS